MNRWLRTTTVLGTATSILAGVAAATAAPCPRIPCEKIDWDDASPSACLVAERDRCVGPVTDGFTRHVDALPKRSMFSPKNEITSSGDPARISSSTDPSKLKSGAYELFDTKRFKRLGGSSALYSSLLQDAFFQSGGAARMSAVASVAAPRSLATDWLSGHLQLDPEVLIDVTTPRIGSCADYVSQVYDGYERFEDKARACGADADCVVRAAFASDGGLANRTLTTLGGKAMKPQIALEKGITPKNAFFAPELAGLIDAYLATAGVTDAERTELTRARARIVSGGTYYGIGSAAETRGVTKRFGTEWDLHDDLRRANAGVPVNMRRELSRRQTALERSVLAYTTTVMGAIRWAGDEMSHLQIKELLNARGGRGPAAPGPIARVANVGAQLGVSAALAGQLNGALALGSLGPSVNAGQLAGMLGGGAGLGASGAIARGPVLMSTQTSSPQAQAWGRSIAAARRAVLDQILLELARADRNERGCLDLADTSCDWLPEDFAARFTSLYEGEREATFDACVLETGDAVKQAAVMPPWSQRSEFLANEEVFEDYLEAHAAERARAEKALKVAPLFSGKPPSDGNYLLAKRGQVLQDDVRYGDPSLASVDYDYDLGWSLKPEKRDTRTASGNICTWNGEAHAKFHAGADFLGKHFPLVSTEHSVEIYQKGTGEARRGQVKIKSHLKFGFAQDDLYDPYDKSHPTSLEKTFSWDHVEKTGGPSATFMAGPVPITIAGFAEVYAGVDATFRAGTHSGECNEDSVALGIGLEGKPWIRSTAVASATVGVPGFGAGVRGRLTLVRAELPVSSNVGLKTSERDVKLAFNTRADLDLSYLDGGISVFAEAFVKSWEYEVIKWPGFHHSTNLWSLSKDVSLGALLSRNGS